MAAESRPAIGPGSKREAQKLTVDEHKHTSVSGLLAATHRAAAGGSSR